MPFHDALFTRKRVDTKSRAERREMREHSAAVAREHSYCCRSQICQQTRDRLLVELHALRRHVSAVRTYGVMISQGTQTTARKYHHIASQTVRQEASEKVRQPVVKPPKVAGNSPSGDGNPVVQVNRSEFR